MAVGVAAILGAGGFTTWWLLKDGGSPGESAATVAASSTTTVTTDAAGGPAPTTPSGTLRAVPVEAFDAVPPEWVSGDDQVRVVEEFGLPSVFTIVFGQDPEGVLDDAEDHRFEYWDYHDMGVRFVFRDGAVMGTRTIPLLGPGYDYPAVAPGWFAAGMTLDDVAGLLGGMPTSGAEVVPEIAGEFVVAVWNDVVAVGFVDGVIVSVETAPVEVGE
ncbi:MAG: hypothetical protein KQH83_04625 [Actinobacteria bacterium]|nr:hypothetical protein [Actinomycetota bacterium]